MPQELRYWICKNTRKSIDLIQDDIDNIKNLILIKYNSYLKTGIEIIIKDKILIPIYDHIVVSGHLCALLSSLGKGAYGKVYKAYDYNIYKFVAIKEQPSINAEIISRQFDITKKNGIGLLDPKCNTGPCFLRNGKGYFIIPLADTNYINWSIMKISKGDYRSIIKSLIKISKDLIYLHSQGKVHMDLKMDNVLAIDDVVYLSDFGKVEKEKNMIPSAMGCYLNYPHCDPNHFYEYSTNPFYKVDRRYDIYSFGILIRELCIRIRNYKLKNTLFNISKEFTKLNPLERKPLETLITYLENVLETLD